MFQYIKSFFVPRLSPEAFEAYFNKLPGAISVNWFRDGRYIIGRIRAEDKQFMTRVETPMNLLIWLISSELIDVPSL